jgi:RHS repeat-associated protein
LFSIFASNIVRALRRLSILSSSARWTLSGLFILFGLVSVSRAVLLPQDTLKLAPLNIYAQSGIDPEIARLSDRDTTTAYSPQTAQQLVVTFESPIEIRTLKIHGPAAYSISVHAETSTGWVPVAGLQAISLAASPEGWNSFPASTPVTAARLRLDVTPVGETASAGLKEIEFWGASQRTLVADGQQLLAALNSQTPPQQGRIYAAVEQQGKIGKHGAGSDDLSDNGFTIQVNRSAADFKRAYLVYETKGLSHWAAAIRSINGNTPQGGVYLPGSDAWTTQIEKINSAWLVQGANRIDFAAADSDSYLVRNVRLMVELEDGTNFVQRVEASIGSAAATYDGDAATGWAPKAGSGSTLDAYFDKPTQVAGLRLNLGAAIKGKLSISLLTNGAWVASNYTDRDAGTLAQGWNELNYPSSFAVDGVRLSFQAGTDSTGDVRELVVLGSGAGRQAGHPALHVTYPDNGQYTGREAYIRGYLAPTDNGNGTARIYVGGKEVSHTDGAYGVLVSKDDVGLSTQADKDPWSVEVKAVYGDATEVRRVVQLNRYSEPAATTGNDGLSTMYTRVPPGKARKLSYNGAELDIGTDALEKELTFGMTPLRDTDVPPLDTGMTNVTKGPHKGYRFTPHGSRFKNKIKVTLPYDRAAIPAGQTEQDIITYYFDEEAGSWKPLERAQVDAAKGVIISYTDHFTDMINATITVPDHPNPASLNPTSIKDIKAADPGAQINLIEPPKANNLGDARLGYPIELPPGRNGMQPALAVQYNSAGGNGWMGMGWDIPMQSIGIDTRWGVPRYGLDENGNYTNLETETYVLDGEQLTPVAHRGELKPRTAEKVFHTRVEGQFRRIIRHGNHPTNYWWEVTDKNGTRFFYGGRPESGIDQNAILADPAKGNVFRWALKEVRDTNGNNILYHYDIVNGGSGGEPWRQIYLRKINYTGSQGAQGPYEVLLKRSAGRTDVIVDGRAGFKSVMDQRLTGIDVSLTTESNPLIRRYSFDYVTGEFSKTLLAKMTQFGEDGQTEFNHHSFDYYDEVATGKAGELNGFDAKQQFSGAQTVEGDGFLSGKRSTSFGGQSTRNDQGHLYVGVAPKGSSKELSAGNKVGYDSTTYKTLLALVDLDGDGLLDQVYRTGDHFSYRPNAGGPAGTLNFKAEVPLTGLDKIGEEKTTTTTMGAQGFALGAAAAHDKSRIRVRGHAYISDVNGDGLPDVVVNGTVYFNRMVANVPTFGTKSPTPLGTSAKPNASGLVENPNEDRAEIEATYHLLDPIRRWVAPYSGIVSISGNVGLLKKPDADYTTADGVRVSIQHNGGEIWSATLSDPHDLNDRPITGLTGISVKAGDRLYFRVNSINDGAFDAVRFNSVIEYQNANLAQLDENGMPLLRFQSSTDFSYGSAPRPWTAPFDGSATVSGLFVKKRPTSDDVRVDVLKNGQVVSSQSIAAEFVGNVPVQLALDTATTDLILVRVFSDSRIDLSGVEFAPRMVYTAVSGASTLTDERGNPIYAFDVPASAQIYPRNASAEPYQPFVVAGDGMLHVTQSVSISAAPPAGYTTQVTLAVKRAGVRLAKLPVLIRDGVIVGSGTLDADIPVKAGDVIYFTVDATDPDTLGYVTVGTPAVSYGGGSPEAAAYDLHLGPAANEAFGGGFRGWYYGEYNGSKSPAPIEESLLRIPTGEKDEVYKQFLGMLPFPADENWHVQDRDSWIGPYGMSSTRKGIKYLDFTDGSDLGGAGGIIRMASGKNQAVSLSLLAFGAGVSEGANWSDVDFLDFNGDRYPDVVGGGKVQATWPNGGLSEQRYGVGVFGRVRESKNTNININLGATTSRTVPGSGGNTRSQQTEMASLGGSGGRGEVTTKWDLIDINGDGLPDYVAREGKNEQGATGLLVRLNLGYRFGAEEIWTGSSEVRTEKTNNFGVNAGGALDKQAGGANTPSYSFGGGIGQTMSKAAADMELIDVNGDGLLDIVVKPVDSTTIEPTESELQVQFNTGNGFTPVQKFKGSLGYPIRENATLSRNAGVYFTVAIPIPYTTISIIINPGYYRGNSLGGYEVSMSDFNGDGYADHIYSDTSGNVSVALNRHGKTNLLKSVRRPLGARIALDYQRSGNTTDQPHSKWVLARSEVYDGHAGDGVDTLLMTYAYENGFYDRAERDFYGYGRTIVAQRDTSHGEAVYRRAVSEYLNRNYYTKGLLARVVMEDGSGRPFTENRNQYTPVTVADGGAVPGLEDFSATVFPQLSRTEQAWYEGQPVPGKQTYTTHKYDDLGNVVEFFDAGDIGANDDVRAVINYTQDTANHIVGKPARIVVEGAGRVMRRREASYAPGTGNLVQVSQYLENGQAAVTDLAYHPNGTLKTVVGPVNHRGQRYQLDYAYDPMVATHITGIVDSFGLSSTASHNYKYGKLVSTVDTNGNPTEYAYDQFGRTTAITGPYQAGSGQATLRFEYQPDAPTPWARTRHLDSYRNIADPIDTVLFTDGLKRVLQTKKDISLFTGTNTAPADVMSVSGRITYDAFGRATAQHYPVTEPLGSFATFNDTYDSIAPTRTEFDVLDRATRVTLPDNTATTMAYGFGADRNGQVQFQTVVTDANGKQKISYRDVQELITSVQEFNQGKAIWTSYAYDPLKQIVEVRDDRGNLTQAFYDNLGRRIGLDNPDTGKTESEFDLAGNLTAKVTANLRAEGKAIRYTYDHLRLTNITYPNFTGNNVTYKYGAPKAEFNRAGRIVEVTDESGKEERFYGKLGEVVKEIKTLASDTQGSSLNSPEVWTTEYQFDTFGRLQRLAYPDGEVLRYTYDAGGNLSSAKGTKNGNNFNYLTRLEYDKFEQRQYLAYGNGTQTQFTYNAQNRRLAALQASGPDRMFQNLGYRYDNVGNILGLQNQVAVPPANSYGGPTAQSFTYDDLYRLTQARGTFDFAPNKQDRYSLDLSYDSIHNITGKQQLHEVVVPGGQSIPQKKTSYNWIYDYSGSHPHAPTHLGERAYRYDANGNQTGWDHDRNGTRRNIIWDEDNRIQSVFDNGHEKTYKYDDQGERVIKRGPQGETAYINQWFTVRNREVASKHVWAGTTRIATGLVPGVKALPRTRGKGTPGGPNAVPQENFLYFYHPDHLGSSSYVTDSNGKVYQHLEYFPFGETWVEESSNTQRTPYLFTGKELDEETGLYYYGARYYDPRTSVWQSPDPMLSAYLGGKPNGGVYSSINLNLFRYAAQNPLKYVDPAGMFEETPRIQEYEQKLMRPPTANRSAITRNVVGAGAIGAIGAAIGPGSALQQRADVTYVEELKKERGPLVNLDTSAVRNLMSRDGASVKETQAKIGNRQPLLTHAAVAELREFTHGKNIEGKMRVYGADYQARTEDFIQNRAIVIPNIPSPQAILVPLSGNQGFLAADQMIFGTGHMLNIPTVSADKSAVKHMERHGFTPDVRLVTQHQ